MIDLTREKALRLSEARKLPMLQRDGRGPDLATMYRWTSAGVRGGVRLEYIIVGGSRCTTAEAVERFIAALNGQQQQQGDVRTPTQRRREIESAERRTALAGI